MKEYMLIKDPKGFRVLGDPTRQRILYLLRAKEMTVSQVSNELGLSPQVIYRHVKKMREMGMVEVAKEVRIDHLIESYYRATAGVFYFLHGDVEDSRKDVDKMRDLLKALKKSGYKVRDERGLVRSLVTLQSKINKARTSKKVRALVGEIDDICADNYKDLAEYMVLMSMDESQFEQYLDELRELRNRLIAGVKRPPDEKAPSRRKRDR